MPLTSYWFPPAPAQLVAASLPAAKAFCSVVWWVALLVAGTLTLLTWGACAITFRSALRIGAFQVVWFPVYALGILPTFLAILAAATFLCSFFHGLFNLKFIVELPTEPRGRSGRAFAS